MATPTTHRPFTLAGAPLEPPPINPSKTQGPILHSDHAQRGRARLALVATQRHGSSVQRPGPARQRADLPQQRRRLPPNSNSAPPVSLPLARAEKPAASPTQQRCRAPAYGASELDIALHLMNPQKLTISHLDYARLPRGLLHLCVPAPKRFSTPGRCLSNLFTPGPGWDGSSSQPSGVAGHSLAVPSSPSMTTACTGQHIGWPSSFGRRQRR